MCGRVALGANAEGAEDAEKGNTQRSQRAEGRREGTRVAAAFDGHAQRAVGGEGDQE